MGIRQSGHRMATIEHHLPTDVPMVALQHHDLGNRIQHQSVGLSG